MLQRVLEGQKNHGALQRIEVTRCKGACPPLPRSSLPPPPAATMWCPGLRWTPRSPSAWACTRALWTSTGSTAWRSPTLTSSGSTVELSQGGGGKAVTTGRSWLQGTHAANVPSWLGGVHASRLARVLARAQADLALGSSPTHLRSNNSAAYAGAVQFLTVALALVHSVRGGGGGAGAQARSSCMSAVL
jgi:hypothetical protein